MSTTRGALQQYLTEIAGMVAPGMPMVPPELVRFLVAFSRLNLLGMKYFLYGPLPIETQIAAVAEQVAAGGVADVA